MGRCALCLARGRRLQAARGLQVLGLPMESPELRMCWECRAILLKIYKFKKRVLLAQKLIQECSESVNSLSDLGIAKKTFYDNEYIHSASEACQSNIALDVEPKIESDEVDSDVVSIFDVWADSVKVDDFKYTENDQKDKVESYADHISQDEFKVEIDNGNVKSEPVDTEPKPKAKLKVAKFKKDKSLSKATPKKRTKLKRPKEAEREVQFSSICEKITGSREEVLVARQNYRRNSAVTKAPHHCWSCIVKFDSVTESTKHAIEKHSEELGDIVCDICKCRFESEELLSEHRTFHDDNIYKCKLCTYLSPTAEHFLKHYRSHEGQRFVRVKIHEALFVNERLAAIKRVQVVKNDGTDVERPGDKVYECDICGAKLTKSSFPHHYDVHLSDKSYECDCCGKIFKTRRQIFTHMRVHQPPKDMCHICGRKFIGRTTLKTHLLSHSGIDERPFACTKCPKRFIGKDKLDRHVKVHDNIKPFNCTLCKSIFRMHFELTYHMKRRHSIGKIINREKQKRTKPQFTYIKGTSIVKQNEGNECDPGPLSIQRKPRKTNQRKHVTENKTDSKKETLDKADLTCNICHKVFTQKVILNAHSVVHTGIRPFTCDECGQTFKFSTGLWSHKLLHKGEKSHECTVCGAKFTLKGNLTAHLKIHSGEKPFVCDVCGHRFLHRRNLRNHYKTHMK